MARARNIKPGFFKNEDLAECSAWARLCFAGLWLVADREGRLEDRPKRIKGEIFAYDSIEVEPLLQELVKFGFIVRYAVEGRGLIQITNFSKHQNPHHREPPSDLPPPESPGLTPVGNTPKPQAPPPCDESIAPDKPEASPGLTPPTSDLASGSSRADSGFRIPDSGERARTRTRRPPETPLPEGFAVSPEVRAWAKGKGYGDLGEHLEAFVTKCEAKGYRYVDWDKAFMTAIRDDWARVRQGKDAPQDHTAGAI